jgi:adenosine deaminase
MTDPVQLQAMPKVELHCHLEGCVRPETLLDLAERNGVELPTTDPSHVYDYHDMASFLAIFERLGAALCTPSDFARVTYEALADASRANVVYRETFFNPTTHPACGYADMLSGICDGLAAAQVDHGIVARLIPSIYRGHSPAVARDLVEQVAGHRREEVVGIGIDGDELEGPPARFVEAYRLAGRAGLERTAHAGERFDSREVGDCLDLLGCSRIDHGYGVVRDDDLLARCRDQGVHFTCAWLSTEYHYAGDVEHHPFSLMRAAGLSMSLGGDDPAMGGTDLTADYVTVSNALDWPVDVLRQQNLDALDAAWCDSRLKQSLRSRLELPGRQSAGQDPQPAARPDLGA